MVHAGASNDGKSQSTRAQPVTLDAAGAKPKVETVPEALNEDAQGDSSPKVLPATTESAEPAMAAKNVETIGSQPVDSI